MIITVDRDTPFRSNANYAMAAVFEVTTLILAVWVGACVLRVRQRALGVTSTRSQPVHRALAIRTVVFGIVLFIAVLCVPHRAYHVGTHS
jgi:hypothetical protein